MITRLLIAAIAFASMTSAAEEPMSRLRFTPPEKWERSVDPGTHLESLSPPGGNVSVTFTASMEFAGTAEQWQHEMWSGILQTIPLAGPSQPGVQGEFLTRMGMFNKSDGTKPWICLYTLVRDGRGEGVIFFAAGEKEFFAQLATVNRMIHRATVAPVAAAQNQKTDTKTSAAANSAAGDDGSIAGLYLATTRQLILNPFGPPGSGSWEVRSEFYLLARDGRLFRGRDLPNAPGGDISRFDYVAAQREDPGNTGSYTVRGDEVLIRSGDSETISAKWIAPDTLEIRGTKFKRSVRETQTSSLAPTSSATSATAPQDSLPVLAYNEPAKFDRGAGTSPIAYSSSEVDAGVRIYAFRPFTGDIVTSFKQTLLREWIDPQSRESALATAPEFFDTRVSGATSAIAARFHENIAGLLNERMRMLVIVGNMAAIVDVAANSTTSWQRVASSMGVMLDSLRVEREEVPPSVAGGTGPGGAAIAGLYMGSKSKYVVNLNRPVGYGDNKLALHYYFFSADGRVYCCYDFAPGPDGDWRHFDFDAAQRDDPVNTGRYTVRGNQLFIQMSAPGSEMITATIRDANSVEIQAVKYVREKWPH